MVLMELFEIVRNLRKYPYLLSNEVLNKRTDTPLCQYVQYETNTESKLVKLSLNMKLTPGVG